MKTNISYFLILPIFLLSCTTSSFFVSESADISKYQFAAISEVMDYTGSASLMNMDVRIYDIVSASRLTMIGEREIETFQNKEQLLLVKYSVSQSSDESVVSITFVDYLTLRPIATCTGAYGLGLGVQQDLQVALKKAGEQVQLLFSNE